MSQQSAGLISPESAWSRLTAGPALFMTLISKQSTGHVSQASVILHVHMCMYFLHILHKYILFYVQVFPKCIHLHHTYSHVCIARGSRVGDWGAQMLRGWGGVGGVGGGGGPCESLGPPARSVRRVERAAGLVPLVRIKASFGPARGDAGWQAAASCRPQVLLTPERAPPGWALEPG